MIAFQVDLPYTFASLLFRLLSRPAILERFLFLLFLAILAAKSFCVSVMSENVIKMLVSMGFGVDDAKNALEVCGANVEAAANFLLSDNASGADNSRRIDKSSSDISTVHCPLSQFDVPSGKSACI